MNGCPPRRNRRIPSRQAALAEAIVLATESGAELAVITVWRALQGDYGLAYPPSAMLDDLLQAERRHAEAALRDAAEQAEAAGVRVRTRLATGDPVDRSAPTDGRSMRA